MKKFKIQIFSKRNEFFLILFFVNTGRYADLDYFLKFRKIFYFDNFIEFSNFTVKNGHEFTPNFAIILANFSDFSIFIILLSGESRTVDGR